MKKPSIVEIAKVRAEATAMGMPATGRPYALAGMTILRSPSDKRRDGLLLADLAQRGLEPQVTWVRDGYLETIRQRAEWSAPSGL